MATRVRIYGEEARTGMYLCVITRQQHQASLRPGFRVGTIHPTTERPVRGLKLDREAV